MRAPRLRAALPGTTFEFSSLRSKGPFSLFCKCISLCSNWMLLGTESFWNVTLLLKQHRALSWYHNTDVHRWSKYTLVSTFFYVFVYLIGTYLAIWMSNGLVLVIYLYYIHVQVVCWVEPKTASLALRSNGSLVIITIVIIFLSCRCHHWLSYSTCHRCPSLGVIHVFFYTAVMRLLTPKSNAW